MRQSVARTAFTLVTDYKPLAVGLKPIPTRDYYYNEVVILDGLNLLQLMQQ